MLVARVLILDRGWQALVFADGNICDLDDGQLLVVKARWASRLHHQQQLRNNYQRHKKPPAGLGTLQMLVSELAQMERKIWHSGGYEDFQLAMDPPGFHCTGSLLAKHGPLGQLELNFHHLMACKACLYEDHR